MSVGVWRLADETVGVLVEDQLVVDVGQLRRETSLRLVFQELLHHVSQLKPRLLLFLLYVFLFWLWIRVGRQVIYVERCWFSRLRQPWRALKDSLVGWAREKAVGYFVLARTRLIWFLRHLIHFVLLTMHKK